jgi:hypothetical protein
VPWPCWYHLRSSFHFSFSVLLIFSTCFKIYHIFKMSQLYISPIFRFNQYQQFARLAGIAKVVEWLPSKWEALSSNPSMKKTQPNRKDLAVCRMNFRVCFLKLTF